MGEPADRPYGERSGFVQDSFGNLLFIATRFPSNPAPEGVGTILPFVHPQKARPYIDFLKRAFGAQEMAVIEHGGQVVHAAVRIGDSVLEMGESHDEAAHLPSTYFMYVEDVDAVYETALAAGAKSLRPPTDTPYGHRDAGVEDPAGYTWWPATLLEPERR
jgi:uncharacterized glyoxalase superfamily protein PhnB